MDQRYGAWAQLMALFRAVYDGCSHPQLKMPARRGHLFDPDRYQFLDGRTVAASTGADRRLPLVSDGVVYRVLRNLLILDGQRLSYRTLDVEQIGSVYETMMGFKLRTADGVSIAIKPAKAHGAPTPVNLESLLAIKPADRAKWLAEQTDQKLTDKAAEALKKADALDAALAAIESKIDRRATPHRITKGTMMLVPSDERRRSGSHYTPRSLTEPIVRKALDPILKRLGDNPTPQRILELKICDLAVGSGAFLVETDRQLAEHLVRAWHAHSDVPRIPPDEDELLYAKRLVAQRCLYGVDRNPMAVDLAKLSLWLATLAKDHPFTFLDHAIRHGDSLVGLSQRQICGFHWKPSSQTDFNTQMIDQRVNNVRARRQEILEAGDFLPFETKREKLDRADEELNLVRFIGDLAIAAFFSDEKDKARQVNRDGYLHQIGEYLRTGNMTLRPGRFVDALRSGDSLQTIVETHSGGGIYRVPADNFCLNVPARSILAQHQTAAALPSAAAAPAGPGLAYYSASGDQILTKMPKGCTYVAFDANPRTRQRLQRVAEYRGRADSLKQHVDFRGGNGGPSAADVVKGCDPKRTLVMVDPFKAADLDAAMNLIPPEFRSLWFLAKVYDGHRRDRQAQRAQAEEVWERLRGVYGHDMAVWSWEADTAPGLPSDYEFALLAAMPQGGAMDLYVDLLPEHHLLSEQLDRAYDYQGEHGMVYTLGRGSR